MRTHRTTSRKLTAAATLPLAIAILATGVASATPPEQPGVAAQPAPPTTAPRQYLGGYQPPANIAQAPWRTLDDAQAGRTQPQARPPASNPAPEPAVPPPAIVPVEAPPNTLLIGTNALPRPEFIAADLADRINNTVSAVETEVGNLLVANGVSGVKADRIVAGVAGGVAAGTTAGIVVGVPVGVAAAVGAGAAGVIWGSGIGAVAIPAVGAVPGAAIGAAVGAVAGAAVGVAAGAAAAAVVGVPTAIASGLGAAALP